MLPGTIYLAAAAAVVIAARQLTAAAVAHRSRRDAALADRLIDANRAVPCAGMERVDRDALARWGTTNADRHERAEASLRGQGA